MQTFETDQSNHLVLNLADLRVWLSRALLEDRVGFDIETQSLNPHCLIAGFSLYLPSVDQAIYVPLNHPSHQMELTPDLVDLFAGLKVKTYKGDFDLSRWEIHYGKTPILVGDGLIVSKMLQLHKFGLKQLAEELGIVPETIRLTDVTPGGTYDFTQAPVNDLTRDYGCQDARLAVQVEEAAIEKWRNPAHHPGWDTVYRLELDMMLILERMTIRGVPIDKDEFDQAAVQMRTGFDALNVEICSDLKRNADTFKINSSKKLASALYNSPTQEPTGSEKTAAQIECALPGLGLTAPDKKKSTAKDVLSLIVGQHPVLSKILEWKTMHSIITRDLPQLEEFAGTGVLHPQFIQIGEDGTSRIYTKQPNLISMSMNARRAMHPSPGKVYAHVDYDAAEWWIGALLSGSNRILDSLEAGIDPHYFTYSVMTNTPLDQVSKAQREIGKVLNYSIFYGTSSYTIAMKLGIEQSAAAVLIEDFFEAYPELAAWIAFRKHYCAQHARTYTVLGRSRALREVFTRNTAIKKGALRQAVNTAGQGCLRAQVRVLTDRGYLRIGDLWKQQEAGEDPIKVWTGNKFASFEVRNMGKAKCVDLGIKMRGVLSCDDRHKVKVARETGWEWTGMQDLKVGDKVAIARPPSVSFDLDSDYREYTGNSPNSLDLLIDLNGVNWNYVLGFIVGDGCFGKIPRDGGYWINLFVEGADACGKQKIEEALEAIGLQTKTSFKQHPQKKVESWNFSCKALGRALADDGMKANCGARNKAVPDSVFGRSWDARVAFIRGVFDTDGGKARADWGWHSSSGDLVRGLYLLLRTLGVDTRLNQQGDGSWKLMISNKPQFEKLLGLENSTRKKNFGSGSSLLSFMKREAAEKMSGLNLSRSDQTIRSRVKGGGSSFISTIDRIVGELIEENHFYDEVEFIKFLDETEETFTLDVDDPQHQFDSEGVISKNSCGDVLKLGMRNLDVSCREGDLAQYNAEMCCPVFDAILIELDANVCEDPFHRELAESYIRDAMEVHLTHEGRTIRMRASIGWSTDNWAAACGK